MKKGLFLLTVFLLGAFSGIVMATTYDAGEMTPPYYYIVDYDRNTTGEVDIATYHWPQDKNYEVQYSFDNTNWNSVNNNSLSVSINRGSSKKIYWRLWDKDSNTPYNTADLKLDGGNGQENGFYNSATLAWSDVIAVTFQTVNNNDKISAIPLTAPAAPVPLPPSAWILGIGLAGLLLIRRKEERIT